MPGVKTFSVCAEVDARVVAIPGVSETSNKIKCTSSCVFLALAKTFQALHTSFNIIRRILSSIRGRACDVPKADLPLHTRNVKQRCKHDIWGT